MRFPTTLIGLGAFLAAGFVVAAERCAIPGDCSCQGTQNSCCTCCGGHSCCHKVCKLICVMEEVKKTVWVVQCKEFCVPNPRLCGGKCGSCGQVSCCCKPSCPPPKCGPVRTKKELVKKEIVCKVPTYKCVVACCGRCPGDCCGCATVKQPAPAAPQTPQPTMPSPQPAPSPK